MSAEPVSATTAAAASPRPEDERLPIGRSFTYGGADCDVDDLMAGADASKMTVVADEEQAARHSFRPAFQFVTFDCHKPR